VLVDEGSYVRRGQTLAIIKTDVLNIDLETAQAGYQNALKDKQRYENAFKTGGVTQQQLDQAKLALENAAARVGQARIRVSDANIRSSINGIVNKRYIEPGAVVNPGTQLFELVDVSKLKLQITVNETQVASLKTGTKVDVKASVFPDETFTGTVRFIAPMADASLNFPVEVELSSNPGNKIKAGMYGTALFNFGTTAPVITLSANKEGDDVILTIADNGPGATNEQLKALYDDTAAIHTKNGLVLHIIRDLAKAINCTISVNAVPGMGTTFYLKFDTA
ncbi:MAG: efflux RND transporter periplasmic adaptor subunit, partial [Sphingobacteriales bacterium]